MDIRRVTSEEISQANDLLTASGLHPLPTRIHLSDVLVGLEAGRVVGVVALEVAARRGLTLWAAVSQEQKGKGLDTSLLRSLISRAQELGLRDLYAVPLDSAPVFAQLGFEPVAETEVPSEIRSLRSWANRPDGASGVLCLVLETRV